ncbi:MAG: glutamyl-tRNA reductase [Firmicutes bacterium]|nr:glutamyl-tRNA reductase [Bacillota bacterium]
MHILVAGVSYKRAPVAVREAFAVSEDEAVQFMKGLCQQEGILETVLLSTCNRTEIYAVSTRYHEGETLLRKALTQRWPHGTFEESWISTVANEEAMRHLFEVAAGLDSMVLGETQILGQVRRAYELAKEAHTVGPWLDHLFRGAMAAGKRVQSETAIGHGSVSIGHSAVEFAKKERGSLQETRPLLIGAGQTAQLVAKHLAEEGVAAIDVVSRTPEHARRLAQAYNGNGDGLHALEEALARTTIVFAAARSSQPLLKEEHLQQWERSHPSEVLLAVDLGLPRNIAVPKWGTQQVRYCDLDTLQSEITANLQRRQHEVTRSEAILSQELQRLHEWVIGRQVGPLVQAISVHLQGLTDHLLTTLYNKLPDLDEHARKTIERHVRTLQNQFLHQPIAGVRQLAETPHALTALALTAYLFGSASSDWSDHVEILGQDDEPTESHSLIELLELVRA